MNKTRVILLKHVSLDAEISIKFSIPQNSAFCMILTSFGGRWDFWNFDIDMLAAFVFPSKEGACLWWKQKRINVPEEEKPK
jgi:hypothetical protein